MHSGLALQGARARKIDLSFTTDENNISNKKFWRYKNKIKIMNTVKYFGGNFIVRTGPITGW